MEKLALFDIDKTLIGGSEEHPRSFTWALRQVYGVDAAIDIIDHQGKSDQRIIIDVLEKKGLDEGKIKAGLEDCIKAMVEYYSRAVDRDKIVVLDGVLEILAALAKKHILLGLVTGNLEPIARAKMKKVGLDNYFKVGGFGSDDIDRANLIKLAIARVINGGAFVSAGDVYVFGDAYQDIRAGRKAGVKTVGVATGDYSAAQLESFGADFVLENLKDTDKILKIISA